jgi:hypothetical protein
MFAMYAPIAYVRRPISIPDNGGEGSEEGDGHGNCHDGSQVHDLSKNIYIINNVV